MWARWWKLTVSAMTLSTPVTVQPSLACQDAIEIMNREGFDQLPVLDESGSVMGVVTLGNLISNLIAGKVGKDSPVENAVYKQFKMIYLDTKLGKLSRILDLDHFALVVHEQKQFTNKTTISKRMVVIGIVSRIDLLNFVTQKSAELTRQASGASSEASAPSGNSPREP